MRIFLIVLIIFCLNSVFAEPQKIDSVYNEKISILQDSLNSLAQKYILIEKELMKLDYQNDHFNGLLTEQTGIFSAIILVVITLIGFISFDRIKKEINDQARIFEDTKRELLERHEHNSEVVKDLQIKLIQMASEIHYSTFERHLREKDYTMGTYFGIRAAAMFQLLNKEEATLKILNLVSKTILEMKYKISSMDDYSIKVLSDFSKSNNFQINYIATNCLNDFIKKIKTLEELKPTVNKNG
jgi:hypothetical protein